MYMLDVFCFIYGYGLLHACAAEEVWYTESQHCEQAACSDRCKKEATKLGYKVFGAACHTDVKCCCTFRKEKAPGPLPAAHYLPATSLKCCRRAADDSGLSCLNCICRYRQTQGSHLPAATDN